MSDCDLCKPSPHQILWQDDFCRVVLLNDVDYPAYCRVELLEHIKEMTDLAPHQRARTMKIVFAVELALREITHADKINLASLGNKTPHVHWHVIPRFEHDKHFPNSYWGEALRDGGAFLLNESQKKDLQNKVKAHIECSLQSEQN
ncbi:MAG: HIT family protein [Pseudomonadota bacterium]